MALSIRNDRMHSARTTLNSGFKAFILMMIIGGRGFNIFNALKHLWFAGRSAPVIDPAWLGNGVECVAVGKQNPRNAQNARQAWHLLQKAAGNSVFVKRC